MRFIYVTSKKYPSSTADHFFVRNMAQSFGGILGDKFTFIINDADPNSRELDGINIIKTNFRLRHGRSLFYLFWIKRFIREHNLDNCDATFFSNDPNLLVDLIFLKKTFGYKYLIVSDWHMLFGNWRDKFIAKNSDKLIATTDHLKGLLVSGFRIKSDRILVTHGGVDMRAFEAIPDDKLALRRELNLPMGAFIAGYVGFYKTMGMSKGLDTMIKALKMIDDKKVCMVFVGGKDKEIKEYKSMALSEGVNDRCYFIPVVPQNDIPRYEKAMDVLVIPYPNKPHFSDYGFPMKTYEYMASGVPVIYSDLEIIGEVLGDCATSFIADDSHDLASKIESILENQTRVRHLASVACNKVLKCTWNMRAKKIVDFIDGLS